MKDSTWEKNEPGAGNKNNAHKWFGLRVKSTTVALILTLLTIIIACASCTQTEKNHQSAYSGLHYGSASALEEIHAPLPPAPSLPELLQPKQYEAISPSASFVPISPSKLPELKVSIKPPMLAAPSTETEQPTATDTSSDKAEQKNKAATGKKNVKKVVFPEPDKVAYITIDDGPSRSITSGILDLLKEEGIKATFFVLPHKGVDDIYQRIIDEGHELGNHSYSHDYSKIYNAKDIEQFREDLLMAHNNILEKFGYTMTSYRFPGGSMGRDGSIIAEREELLAEYGYRYFNWTVDSRDAHPKQTDKSADALTSNVLDKTRGRDKLIVLMHDTKSKTTTLEALPQIISGLREQGYSFDVLQNY